MAMTTIQAVFFDMGGTIQTFGYTPELRLAATPGLRSLLSSAGIDLQLDDRALCQLISDGLDRYHRWSIQSMQEISPLQVWRDYILEDSPEASGLTEDLAEQLMFYIETQYYERAMRPEMPVVLEAIKKMGLKIGLISNVCSKSQVPANLEEYGILHYFDPLVLSSEYGRRKPDPAIFHYAARLANVPTSACLYVGDRIARDIVGSRKAGYRYAVQIINHFSHGEAEEGAEPDVVIDNMMDLLEFIKTVMEHDEPDESDKHETGGVRALLFDAGDILYHRPNRGEKFKGFLRELGKDTNGNRPAEIDSLTQQAYHGEINQDQFRAAVLRAYGITQPEQVERGKEILAEEDDSVEFFDGVQETMLKLKEKGLLLGIVTDTANPIHVKLNWFDHGGFVHVWDSIISSHEIGTRKPDPAIYGAALKQLGVASGRAAFVGHKATELDGARAVGMTTIAFNYENDATADFYIQQFCELLTLPVLT